MTSALNKDSRTDQTFALEGGPSGAVFVGAGLAMAAEGAVFHLYLVSTSQLLAWAVTTLNIAALIWLWRYYKAYASSELTVGDQRVVVALGKQMRCRFARSSIASVDVATWRSVPEMAGDYVNAAKPLEPNVMVILREPAQARLPFGIRKRFTRLGVRVSDPSRLVAELRRDLG